MSLPSFLAPASHLLFANRNLDIVVLCFILFAVAMYALTNRWRADRLERELANSRSSGSMMAAGRRYTAAPAVQESAPEPGGLPPVKGGRSYARNLGSALQKSGVAGPQIYSPPTPPGFSPHTTPLPGAVQAGMGQPGMGQPGIGQPYAPPSGPWPTPPSAPAPWAFPGPAGRSGAGAPPQPAPFFGPPPGGPASPASPFAPAPSAPAGPGQFAPPSLGQPPQPAGPFAAPFGAPPSRPAAMPPAFAPPGVGPMTQPAGAPPAGPPPYPVPPMVQPPTEPEPADASRRGKPKRRRFNFNVLENLEKMVQAKPAEPAPQTGWTPPAAPVPPPAPVNTSAPVTPTPVAPTPALTPSPETATVTPKPEAAPTLPFLFGGPKPSEPAKGATAPPAEMTAPDDTAVEATETFSEESTAVDAEAPVPSIEASEPETSAPEPVVEEASKEGQSSHRSMRSMMFGEEITATEKAAADPEPAPADEPELSLSPETATTPTASDEASTASSDSSWTPYPWERRQETSDGGETEEPAAEVAPEPAPSEAPTTEVESWSSNDEPSAPSAATESEWSASSESAAESSAAEPAVEETAEPIEATSSDHGSDTSGPSDGGKPSAGTLVIIEDDQTAASYYSTLFRGNGYEVEVANDGISGVDLCAKVQPQVILLDVMMPRQNGILVLQTLRASDETKNTPVVVMSNFSEPTLIKRALQLGALEYVIKTQVEGPALLNALPRWMNREKAFAAA